MYAIEVGLREIDSSGTQSEIVETMQHRSRLYELLRYPDYNEFDQNIFDFTIPGGSR
jgi:methylisocitrate lyase